MTLAEILRRDFRCSMREARRLIEFGDVTVEGEVVTVPDAMFALPVEVAVRRGSRTHRRRIHDWGFEDVV